MLCFSHHLDSEQLRAFDCWLKRKCQSLSELGMRVKVVNTPTGVISPFLLTWEQSLCPAIEYFPQVNLSYVRADWNPFLPCLENLVLTTDSLPWHSRGPSGWTSVRLCTLIPRYCPSCSPGPEEQHCWLLPKLSLCFSVSICSLFCLPSFLSSHPPHFYPLFTFKVKHCSFHKSGCRED